MSKFLICALTTSVFLTGCATSQENPNYKFSSKYKTGEGVQQLASTTPQVPVQTVNYTSAPIQTAQSVNYQTHSNTPALHHTQAQTQPIYIEDARIGEPTPSQPAPTDQQYVGESLSGTPGYGVFIPEEVQYDYNQNVVTANSEMPFSESSQSDVRDFGQSPRISVPSPIAAGNYTVKQGDTMYSLSRGLCVSLDYLVQTNGIGGDYAIKIGQPLNLPASQC